MSIKVSNVSFTYYKKTPNKYQALHDISLEIPSNSFTGIVGHTGSGKSTLVQLFNGLLIPDSGRIEIDDKFVIEGGKKKVKHVRELRKHLGLVFQFPEYQLFEETVEKDVAFGLRNYGVDEKTALEKAHKTLVSLGLDESYFKRSPFELSGGEKRKVALAGILVLEPKILVLDEPTAGLDPKSASDVMHLVAKLHEQGTTIIMITHDMDMLFRYCERVLLLKDGRLDYDGDPTNLFTKPEDELSIEIPKIFEFIQILNKKGLKVPYSEGKSKRNLIDFIAERKANK